MQTLQSRLNYLADIYFLQAPPLLLVLGVSVGSASVLAWTSGALLVLATLNKVRKMLVRSAQPT
jgi:hypothetical protein